MSCRSLPQGRTIMTTEPKFVPEQAVRLELDGGIELRARMIDCVGYLVPGAMGHGGGRKARMRKAPWFDEKCRSTPRPKWARARYANIPP